MLSGVPKTLPALLRAFRIQEKTARFGFDWKNAREVLDKVNEEFAEFQDALENDRANLEEEFGDLLFSLVNLGRHLDLQPEEALNGTISKFMKRFRFIEEKLREAGKTVADSNLEEMDRFWEESKKIIDSK